MADRGLVLVMTRGVSGSGKTVWSKRFVDSHPGTIPVSLDELFVSLGFSVDSAKEHSTLLWKMGMHLAEDALSSGYSVVFDDLGLSPENKKALEDLASRCAAVFRIQDFSHIPLETCIRRQESRDLARRVRAEIIRRQYESLKTL